MQHFSDDYLIGFAEGEGMFYVGIVPSKETKTGWQIIHFFKIVQPTATAEAVLQSFKKRLGCGYIKYSTPRSTERTCAYIVRDLKSLSDKLIPFFEGKLHVKLQSFEKFKQVIEMVRAKKHLDPLGMTLILEIAYSMNTKKRKVAKKDILQAYKLESSQAIR
jgi:hypothetical protein